jgi:polyhydroxybutyrate depolymerase
LHGYGGSAKDMQQFSGMNKVADNNKFAVCYPQGNFGEDKKNSWNAGYSNDDVDDVKFLCELAKFLHKNCDLSEQNTFSTGMSNGADMCYVLACNRPDAFSAIAPVAGCMMENTFNNCKARKAIPVFEIHGTDDDITLWIGDPNYSEKYGAYLGTQTVVDYWIKKNECSETIRELKSDRNTSDKSFIVAEKHINNSTKNQVWLYTLVGGKHDWHGAWGNMDIDADAEIWDFFSQFLK